MGYSTDFTGGLAFDRPVAPDFCQYINAFSYSRRMKRNGRRIMETDPDWTNKCWNGDLGVEGEYYVGGGGLFGQRKDPSIIEYNYPPSTQPGLWCQWIIENDTLVWDGGEKFYHYVEWLQYLIDNFIEPYEYKLNGEIHWQGEDDDDFGIIRVVDNVVSVFDGVRNLAEIREEPANQIQMAEKCLVDNGIDPDEAATVLQALGYILLDKDLYEEAV